VSDGVHVQFVLFMYFKQNGMSFTNIKALCSPQQHPKANFL